MKEKIYVRNFGPIVDVEIDIKNINVFIGTTSSGKSTIAKLIAIFKSEQLQNITGWMNTYEEQQWDDLDSFNKILASYNIDFTLEESTFIRYESDELFCEFSKGTMKSSVTLYSHMVTTNPVYIPAERVFFSTLSQSIFSLINSDVALPKWLLDFGGKFEKARRDVKSFNVDFLDARYSFSDGNDLLHLPNDKTIKLSQGSSGLQSIIPLMLVIHHLTRDIESLRKELTFDLFIVEEPEMNLYPSSQRDLLEFIISRIKQSQDKLIITTHSPYLLTALDNLVQAGNVAYDQTARKRLSLIVPESLWTDFDQVTCYFFDNGHVRSTLDTELRSLGPSNIDDVSSELGKIFDELLKLKYKAQ